MGQEDQNVLHRFVQLDRVALLDKLPNNLSFVVLHDQYFLGLDHSLDERRPESRQDVQVPIPPHGEARKDAGRGQSAGREVQQRGVSERHILAFFVEFLNLK
jgi:hypothetical protein